MQINPFELLKNAQKVQETVASLQERLGDLSVTGASGGGMVEVDMSGKMEVLAVRVTDDTIAGDTEMLGDLLAAALNNAMDKVRDLIRQNAVEMAGDGNLDLSALANMFKSP